MHWTASVVVELYEINFSENNFNRENVKVKFDSEMFMNEKIENWYIIYEVFFYCRENVIEAKAHSLHLKIALTMWGTIVVGVGSEISGCKPT